MTLYDVFDWLEQTPIGEAIRGSSWLFPVVEAAHLVGLAIAFSDRQYVALREAEGEAGWDLWLAALGSLLVPITTGALLFGTHLLLRKGKRNYTVVSAV